MTSVSVQMSNMRGNDGSGCTERNTADLDEKHGYGLFGFAIVSSHFIHGLGYKLQD